MNEKFSGARKMRRQPKSEAATRQLQEMIRELPAGTQLPPVLELCETLHVSKVTLDTVLGTLEAQGLVNRVPRIGVFVGQKNSRVLILFNRGLLQDSLNAPFWRNLLEQLKQGAQSHGMETAVEVQENSEAGYYIAVESLRAILQEQRMESIIAVGFNEPPTFYAEFDLPLVTFAGYGRYVVDVDEEQGLVLGIEALVQSGCRVVEHWDAVDATSAARPSLQMLRLATFADSAWRMGVEYSPESVRIFTTGTEQHAVKQAGYRAAMQRFGGPQNGMLAKEDRKVQGLVFINDVFTLGVLQALDELGLQVGADIQIATHTNVGSPLLEAYLGKVTLLEIHTSEIVNAIYELLSLQTQGVSESGNSLSVRHRLKH